jgi:hypothetical protein
MKEHRPATKLLCLVLCVPCVFVVPSQAVRAGELRAGFAEEDITPRVGDKPVYMAGFGHDRKATGVLDPLKARAVVLEHDKDRLALVALDLVGFFHASVLRVRDRLPGYRYVLVCSTHNHEGPDSLGLWGRSPFTNGVDPDYLKSVEDRTVRAVQAAAKAARPVTARLGTARDAGLLNDTRLPVVKHDELVALRFDGADKEPAGLVVQWNCHPETLGSNNTKISADFVGATVSYLQDGYHCPVVYLNGSVGGLMTTLGLEVKDDKGNVLPKDSVEKTVRYGRLVGELADRALAAAKEVSLTPFAAHSRDLFLPIDNKFFLFARGVGVLPRQGYLWTGDAAKAEPADPKEMLKPLCLRTEVAWLRLGELDIAAIPGEIYPELVLDRVENPAVAGADFPDAPVEPAVYKQLRGPHRLLIGLANDEIGYIIPKRQWDEKPPYCYGRKEPQYGEVNSLGPETAPLLCRAFADLVAAKKK